MPVVDRSVGETALERVRDALGSLATSVELNYEQVDITCDPGSVVEVVTKLKETPGIECRFFTFLSAVDRTAFGGDEKPDEERGTPLEVLIHLYSPDHATHVNVHVPVDINAPRCPSITSVFGGALWAERETHEMFGVHFEGHPNLTNLYLPEDFEGHPLRRTFKLRTRMVKPWPGAKDPEEAAGGGRG
ncbi:MAG: NADH-quinone oxidoreductase subunit C [Actinomycetota bacterium]